MLDIILHNHEQKTRKYSSGAGIIARYSFAPPPTKNQKPFFWCMGTCFQLRWCTLVCVPIQPARSSFVRNFDKCPKYNQFLQQRSWGTVIVKLYPYHHAGRPKVGKVDPRMFRYHQPLDSRVFAGYTVSGSNYPHIQQQLHSVQEKIRHKASHRAYVLRSGGYRPTVTDFLTPYIHGWPAGHTGQNTRPLLQHPPTQNAPNLQTP